jgi:hypothetical protein
MRHISAATGGRLSGVRKDRLRDPLGQLSSTDLSRIRLGVAAVIGLGDLLL